ncbi:MAG: glycosyltransferase [Spirochaetota bacterium]
MIPRDPGTLLLIVLGVIDLALLLWIAGARVRNRLQEARREWVRDFMQVAFVSAPLEEVVRVFQRDTKAFMSEYMQLAESIELPAAQREKLQQALVRCHAFPRMLRDLQSRRRLRRMRAAIWLSYALPEQATAPLVATLEREPSRSVRIHIAHSLVRLGNSAVIPTIVDTLAGSDAEYQEQVYGLVTKFGEDLHAYFDLLRGRRESEIRRLLAKVAASRGDETGMKYLLSLTESDDRAVAIEATRLLLESYIQAVDVKPMLASGDSMVVNLTLEAMGELAPERAFETLLAATANDGTRKSAIVGLSRLVHDRPQTYSNLVESVLAPEKREETDALLEVLANRVEYLIERVLREDHSRWATAIERLVETGRVSGVIGFLNRNEDPAVETTLTSIIRPRLEQSSESTEMFAIYAKESVRERLSIASRELSQSRGERVGESIRPLFVVAILAATIVLPAAIFVVTRLAAGAVPELSWLREYAREFTRAFGVYAFTLNLIYLLLLAGAAAAIRQQQAALEIKPLSMLFSAGMLPSISIVAPAYNEESTIVESVNSLLNLRYPDFEIIVVNDGSPDATLRVLIERFELERTDIFLHGYLETQPVRGIYRNPRIPELIVIDKQNGGKADSLNVGINASRKTYFAAIDSDSLLERDSLLRLAARFLDSDAPVVASGGNIFPVNGCSVSLGKLDEIHLPREPLARFQTLEYIRSFMAGRTGWAAFNSLMIISGAFGLFRKRDVIDAHGYLTGSGFYAKDTVAEDMELVVRVARMLRERNARFAIQYGYNANCWTEVPTTHRILRNQRDRWQRGLIDTMFFHARMLANPKYGTMGVVGFPYFFLFELLGPWFEIQGLVFLITGLTLGIMPTGVVLFVIAATIPMGVAVSLSSLLLAEFHQRYFPPRERLLLIVLAILENFGYRQYASVLRLRGYISALGRRTGWGTMVRTGFSRGSG